MENIKLVECPRDAMQGISEFIPTDLKINYLNQLLKVGFDILDFGSFVSPKAIPQLSDTHEVVKELDLSDTNTKLLAIIANERGANDAIKYDSITFLGYPFSISEEFQKRNTNSTIEESYEKVKRIQDIAVGNNKRLLIYISMAFGNPYGEEWNADIVSEWLFKLSKLEIVDFALADTIGVSDVDNISYLFSNIINEFTNLEIGAHLHSNPKDSQDKIQAAFNAGCRKFDSAIRGFGGCPMAEDDLVGNIATEDVIKSLPKDIIRKKIKDDLFKEAQTMSFDVFK